MIRLSKRVEYGLIALLHIDGCGGRGRVTAKEIAEAHRLPAELLGKVMQALARAGLVESVQGLGGGYRLAAPLARISVGDVVETLEGPIRITPCCDGSTACRQLATCNIRHAMQRIQAELVEQMGRMRLDRFRAAEEVRAR